MKKQQRLYIDDLGKELKSTGTANIYISMSLEKKMMNHGELQGEGPALLLIHGQMVSWEDYASVIPDLHENWHIYAIDVYGHGESSHEEELYYLDINGNDIIWFIENVIKQETVVSGHSNGALTAAYVAAYGGHPPEYPRTKTKHKNGDDVFE